MIDDSIFGGSYTPHLTPPRVNGPGTTYLSSDIQLFHLSRFPMENKEEPICNNFLIIINCEKRCVFTMIAPKEYLFYPIVDIIMYRNKCM